MYHSIIFDGLHSYLDLNLVPTSRPAVMPPEALTNYVDVSGIDGPLDLSTALTGFLLYGNRTGSWEFLVKKRVLPWQTEYMQLLNKLHGKRIEKLILEDDPEYYYKGRTFVEGWKSDKANTFVTISYELQPYKYEMTNSLEPWLWDPFSFETGIIREYGELAVSGTLKVTIPGTSRPYIPTITASAAMTVTYKGTVYNLAAGENFIDAIMITEETAELTFSGTGTVSILYQGAWL